MTRPTTLRLFSDARTADGDRAGAEAAVGGGGRQADELEARLVERARAGRADAWARLYELYFHDLLREATYLVGDVSEAEDLVQDVFAVALAKLHTFEARCGFGGWLRGIAINLARKRFRSRARRRRAFERLRQIREQLAPPRGSDVEGCVLDRRRAEALRAVLETLPAPQREVFVLVDLRGHAPADVAKWLGIRPGTLRVRASRARKRIREELERLGWDLEGAT